MGRVEDAMRRAAEAGPAEAVPGAEPAAFGPEEAFPAEEAAGEPAEQPAGEPAEQVVEPTPEPAATGTGAKGTSLATKLVGDERMLTTSREQYRRLAATLHHIQATSGIKVVLIASAVAGEGKTLTASNLALTFSESYERNVLLVDADLRRPSLARTFGVPASPGLSEGLMAVQPGPLPLQQVTERLSVLPGGRPTPDPMAGLTSLRMRELIDEARGAFDWVILDTPPVGLMTDARLLSAIADGVILVVKANSTPYTLVQRAIDALGREQLIGAVLNCATEQGPGDKYYDYYHYGYAAAPRGAAAEGP
jgi:capsular exopolysaccharide synthesis family protein